MNYCNPSDADRTLCWRCRRSYVDKCCWAEEGEPVKRWQAIPRSVQKNHSDMIFDTYLVIHCPLFKDECPDGSTRRTYHALPIPDNTGVQRLAAAIVAQAAKDLAKWLREEEHGKVREVEMWLRSDRARAIMEYDPDELIKAIRRQVLANKRIRKNGAL